MNDVHVIAYFAGDPTRTYQLVQWLEVLEILDGSHRVGLVLRDPDSAALVAARTDLQVFTAPTFPELTELYAAAIAIAERQAVEIDGEQCFLAGARHIAEGIA